MSTAISTLGKSIDRVTIIGTGVMGTQVAWACVAHGLCVTLYDIEQENAQHAERQVLAWLAEDKQRSTGPSIQGGTIQVARTLKAAAQRADLIFENVPEDAVIKRHVFREVETSKLPDALIGSNASSLTWSHLASELRDPSRFFLLNFSPPRLHKLVEYMDGPMTTAHTRGSALTFARKIGMIPVVTRREIMGYIGNRIWRAIKKECLFLLDGDYALPDDIDRAFVLAQGTQLGPCALMDLVGLHSVLRVEEQYFAASQCEADRPPRLLTEMVKRGKLGVSTGQGFYKYPGPSYERPGWLEGPLVPTYTSRSGTAS